MRTVAAYLLLAVALTWPAALHPVAAVPGGDRTDLHDSLWSLWFVWERLASGASPFRVDGLLNIPIGGAFWVADPLNAVLALPLVAVFGPAAAWTCFVLAHLTFTGRVAHALGEAVTPGSGWVTGITVAASPMLLAQIHNGASEAVGQGWLVLALLRLWRLREAATLRNAVAAGVAIGVAGIGHWYGGVDAGIFLVLLLPAVGRWGLLAALTAVVVAAPVALAARSLSTASDNVVGIKTPRELSTVRRTIGAADPVGFLAPGDFRSPDFARISRYGERYVHCHYLGWVVLGVAAGGLVRRRRAPGVWWAALGLGVVFAAGPVVVRDGAPWILSGRRGVPLPYFLLERVPPFDSLSLVYRLAFLSVVSVAVIAGRAVAGWRHRWIVPALALLELRLLSPARDLPEHVDARVDPAIVALAGDPDRGAVMNYPIEGGRPYLYEQTAHGHAVAGTLNFPNNAASKRVWRALLANADLPCPALVRAVGGAARREGIGFLVFHRDAAAADDIYRVPTRRLLETCAARDLDAPVVVYRFDPG